MRELRHQQAQGEAPKEQANKDASVEIETANKHLIHVRLEMKSFNQSTGERTSVPFIQMFYPKEFERMVKEGAFKGYSVDIVHEPASATPGIAKTLSDVQGAGDIVAHANTSEAGTGGDKVDPVGIEPTTETAELTKLNKTELQAKYEERFGEAPDANMTKAELIEAITEL